MRQISKHIPPPTATPIIVVNVKNASIALDEDLISLVGSKVGVSVGVVGSNDGTSDGE
jgi:hypothetical protein